MDGVATFRVRFLFRVGKKLNISRNEYRFNVGKHEVALSTQTSDVAISQSEWLVMNAKGFGSESEARSFANRLKTAAEISSVSARLGIDSGIDLPTAGVGQIAKGRILEQVGLLLRDNVHGVDVFEDDPNVRIFQMNLTASLLTPPDPFLSDLNILLDESENLSPKAKDVILLLNYALIRPDPVAQIVFVTSAVEMLGQQEEWSADQKLLLEKVANDAECAIIGTAEERHEVSAAIKRGTHRIGLRQGVVRLLDALGLGHLKNEWDVLYGQRSTLVHGLAPKPGVDYTELALKTVSLCGQILLTVIAKEVPKARSHIDKFYVV